MEGVSAQVNISINSTSLVEVPEFMYLEHLLPTRQEYNRQDNTTWERRLVT